MIRLFILSTACSLLAFGAIAAAGPSLPHDAGWVDQQAEACAPSAAERKFDQIGWVTTIRQAEALAKEHGRPVFLFTHDGHMAIGRC